MSHVPNGDWRKRINGPRRHPTAAPRSPAHASHQSSGACRTARSPGSPARSPADESSRLAQHAQHRAQRRCVHSRLDPQPLARGQCEFLRRASGLHAAVGLHQRELHRKPRRQPLAPLIIDKSYARWSGAARRTPAPTPRFVPAARSTAATTAAVLLGYSTCRQYPAPAALRQVVFVGCLRRSREFDGIGRKPGRRRPDRPLTPA